MPDTVDDRSLRELTDSVLDGFDRARHGEVETKHEPKQRERQEYIDKAISALESINDQPEAAEALENLENAERVFENAAGPHTEFEDMFGGLAGVVPGETTDYDNLFSSNPDNDIYGHAGLDHGNIFNEGVNSAQALYDISIRTDGALMFGDDGLNSSTKDIPGEVTDEEKSEVYNLRDGETVGTKHAAAIKLLKMIPEAHAVVASAENGVISEVYRDENGEITADRYDMDDRIPESYGASSLPATLDENYRLMRND